MRRIAAAAATCAALGACVPLPGGALPGDLQSARLGCNAQYPRRVGNYLPHALCVNEAVERYAMPTARYPDLVRRQEQARAILSERLDRRQISLKTGERRMREADSLVVAAERDRDAGKEAAARRRVAEIETLLR
jgi:hypothetical protein